MPAAGELNRASDIRDAAGLFVRKLGHESVISSTTLQDDDDLFLAVEANTAYFLQGALAVDGASAADIKIGWSFPTGATLEYGHMGPATTITSDVGNTVDNRRIIQTDVLAIGCNGAGNAIYVPLWGQLIIAGTAGTLRLRWAQFVSSATASRMLAGSFLHAQKMA